MVIVLMGVSGSGKTTVGQALAGRWGAPFYDGDEFHPPENVAKMARGEALDDADRLPWLEALHDLIGEQLAKGEAAVVACSALKRSYRERLRRDNPGLAFVYLRGDFELIRERLEKRQGHYMPVSLLQSQFEALEEPGEGEATIVDIQGGVEATVQAILSKFS